MRVKHLLLLAALGGAALQLALAAEPGVIGSVSRQSDSEREDLGEIAESDAPDSSKGLDDKSVAEGESPFRLNIGARAQYTSNAALSGNHGSSDVIFFPNVEAGYRLELSDQFAWDNALRLESGIYADNFDRTFLGYSLTSLLEWRVQPNMPRLYISAEPYRYDGTDGQGRITQAVGFSAGTDWGYGFNNGNSLFFVGYAFTYHLSDPNIDARAANAFTVGLTHIFMPKLTGQMYYQFNYDKFTHMSRRDFRHVVGASLTYQLTEHLFSTFTASFTDSDSDQRNASYQGAGASIGVNYQF